MMTNHETNLDSKQSSTFMGTLQDKLKDIKNFSNWPAKEQMVAVTAVGVIFGALLPVVAVALPVAAAGAAVALTLFFAVKAVEYGYKGLKWSAEKTWEGAKYTAGKIKAGAVYVKDSVKEGYEHSVDSLKREAHLVRDRITDARNALAVAIYDDREKYEDRSEVKEAAAKRKEDHILKSSREMRSNMFYGDDTSSLSRSSSTSSLNSNSTDGSTAGLVNPEEHKKAPAFKNKMSSLFRRNKAPKEAKEATEVKYQVLPEQDGAMPSATIDPARPRRNSSSSSLPVLTTAVLPKAPESPTSGYGSGRSSPNPSGSSTPTERSPILNDKEFKEKLEKRRASVDQPSVEPVNPGVMYKE
ncbi:MAG: hypothetical protein PG978_000267 [Wolbachia endosymbiont of Ctenocephalides felis wCfeF]|nr:MAG: hypothetical protein PG978_000267 [Wolbachia endosymbiont of Ctenocephalides felis wCfeF]